MDMGERIKQLRIAKGLTQEELGKYIGVQKSAIKKYEKGEVKNLKRSSIQTLSNLFDVSPSYLMCLDENTTNNYFEFAVEDEAMYPILDVGDIAKIQKQTDIENNKYYLILLNKHKTIRKIVLDNNKYTLSGINSYCKEIVIPKNEFSKIQILGKVIEARNKSAFK